MKSLSASLFLLVGASLLYRIFLGIDFTDESYWVVMATRFAQGARPFVDELFVNQTGSLLFTPFIWIFLKLNRSTEGIILYTRLLYLALSLGVALVARLALKKRIPDLHASLLALAFFAIVPLQIPNLSYNSLGSLLFSAGLFFQLNRKWGGNSTNSFFAGACHASSVFAYPSLALPVFYTLFFSGYLRLYLTGFFSCLAILLPFVLSAGENLITALQYSFSSFDHGGGIAKIFVVLKHFFILNIRLRMLLPILLLFLALRQKSEKTRALVLVSFPVLFYFTFWDIFYSQMWLVFYGAALSFFLYPWVKQQEGTRDLLIGIALPSLIAAFCIGWTSSSAPINGVLGMPGAFLVTLIFLWYLAPPSIRLPAHSFWLAILVLAIFQGKAFYRDGDLHELTARVAEGPLQIFKHYSAQTGLSANRDR